MKLDFGNLVDEDTTQNSHKTPSKPLESISGIVAKKDSKLTADGHSEGQNVSVYLKGSELGYQQLSETIRLINAGGTCEEIIIPALIALKEFSNSAKLKKILG